MFVRVFVCVCVCLHACVRMCVRSQGTLLKCGLVTAIAFPSPPQPENILLYRKGQLDIKIADFGLSVQVKEGQEMKTLVGTAEYVCK